MLKINNIILPVDFTENDIREKIKKKLKIGDYDILSFSIIKNSIDAHRRGEISRCVSICAELRGEQRFLSLNDVEKFTPYVYEYPPVSRSRKRPVVVGSGPAGLFAALILSICGAEPIVIERGLDVDSRIKSVSDFSTGGKLNPECNIQFGEGGAGTFSDGKLNTGTKDSRQRKVLEEFVSCGAPDSILTEGKPHIGTDMLVNVVKNMRKKIISYGGEFRFSCRLDDLCISDGKIVGIKTSLGEIDTDTVILATGHSARDTFRMLYSHNLIMEKKSFSVGVRIEHPQKLINEAMYHSHSSLLPPADYKAAVHLDNGRGVYTFCMCPGGSVAAAASEPDSVVTNGMSNYARNGDNANSALLVSILPNDFPDNDVFAGMVFQQKLERSAFYMGGASYKAPVQTVADFLKGQKSVAAGKVFPSYPIGCTYSELGKLFPDYITHSLRSGITLIDRKIKGFALPDAILTAVESRSSSPIRVLRDETMQSNIRGIYPCGEGGGYAGGIMSAAVDGIKAAEAILYSENT